MKITYAAAALTAAALSAGLVAGPATAAPSAPAVHTRAAIAAELIASGCTVHWVGGANGSGWHADYSDTMTVNTKKGQTGDRVREVQCLLTAAAGELDDTALRPGGVDGDFGQNTKNAVVHAQKTYFFRGNSSEWDGEVGAKTWPKLRRYTDYL